MVQTFILCYVTSYNLPTSWNHNWVVNRRFNCPFRQVADWDPGKMTDHHVHELIVILWYKMILQVGNKALWNIKIIHQAFFEPVKLDVGRSNISREGKLFCRINVFSSDNKPPASSTVPPNAWMVLPGNEALSGIQWWALRRQMIAQQWLDQIHFSELMYNLHPCQRSHLTNEVVGKGRGFGKGSNGYSYDSPPCTLNC